MLVDLQNIESPVDGPFPKLCPAVAFSHQDGHHSRSRFNIGPYGWEIHIKIFLSALLEPNFDGMLILCAPLRIVSDSPTDHTFFYAPPRRKVRGHINLPPVHSFVRLDIDTWFVRLSPPTVLELQV